MLARDRARAGHPARMRKRSGGSSMQRFAVDAGGYGVVGVDLEVAAPTIRARAAAAGGRPRRGRSGLPATVIPSRPSSIRGRVPEPTARPSR